MYLYYTDHDALVIISRVLGFYFLAAAIYALLKAYRQLNLNSLGDAFKAVLYGFMIPLAFIAVGVVFNALIGWV